MEPYDWNLEEFLYYSIKWDPEERIPNLLHPHKDIWPENPQEIPKYGDQITRLLNKRQNDLFFCCIAASALLSPQPFRNAGLDWLETKTTPQQLGLPFCRWFVMAELQWTSAPLPLILSFSRKGIVIDMLLGTGSLVPDAPYPAWTDLSMDAQAREQVERAMELASKARLGKGFFFWPMLQHQEGNVLTGNSLGLPIYLGWQSLIEKRTQTKMAATGALSSEGGILPVEGINEKASALIDVGIKSLIFPKGSSLGRHPKHGLEFLPAPDLDTAIAFYKHFLPGSGHSMLLASDDCMHALSIIKSLPDVPLGFLQWLEERKSFLSPALEKVIRNTHEARELIGMLEGTVVKPDCHLDRISWFIRGISSDLIKILRVNVPELAFRFCELIITVSNHTGEVNKASEWANIAESLITDIELTDDADSRIFFLHNLLLVNVHNRFEFDPNLEENLGDEVKKCRIWIEKQMEDRRRVKAGSVSHDLGSFYGTLAQHYGFCGPRYLDKFEFYAAKALDAFGNGHVPGEAFENWLRDISYKVYAYLDAGLYEKAYSSLKLYLQLDSLTEFRPDTNPYRDAALMRYLADTKEPLPEYIRRAWAIAEKVPSRHPWQLWLYNLGRVTADKALKKTAWGKALSICISQLGPTIKAIGLLPLSGLYNYELADKAFLKSMAEKVIDVISREQVSRRHFAPVLSAGGWEAALQAASENIAALFPFTYR